MILEISGIAIFSAFFAGLLTFLAPCTLPIVPGYLGFISGVSTKDLSDPQKAKHAKRKIFLNGVFFVLGFSVVFILLGILAGFLGSKLGILRLWGNRIGGVLVILFGLFMLGFFNIKFLKIDHKVKIPKFLTVGKPSSSFLIGSSFALGWTPCVGPILGGIFTLAAQSSTAFSGALLLSIFSLGLGIPFLATALFFGSSIVWINKMTKYIKFVEVIGGIFLIFIGILLLTDNFGILVKYGYLWFDFYNENFLNYL